MLNYLRRKALAFTLRKAQRLYDFRQNNAVEDKEVQKEIDLYIKSAHYCDRLVGCKQLPYAQQQAMECYRAAASLGDVSSASTLGGRLMAMGRFWQHLGQTALQSDYQQQFAHQCFSQSKALLNFARDRGDTKAMRLLGVMYVNGYGVTVDMDSGLKLITDSITQENAWSKSSAIFAEHGLDRPEFFNKLMRMKGGHDS